MASRYETNILRLDMDKRLVYIRDNDAIDCDFNEVFELTKSIIKKTKKDLDADDMYFNIDVIDIYNPKILGYDTKKNSEHITFANCLEESIFYLIRRVNFYYSIPDRYLAIIINEITQFRNNGIIYTKLTYTPYTIDKGKKK